MCIRTGAGRPIDDGRVWRSIGKSSGRRTGGDLRHSDGRAGLNSIAGGRLTTSGSRVSERMVTQRASRVHAEIEKRRT